MAHRSSARGTAAGRSQRQLRVGEEIRHALAQILQENEARDPLLRDVSITVTEVRVSPDLKNASAYVMPLGGQAPVEGASVEDVVAALNTASPYFRGLVGRSMHLKYTPNLKFILDDTFEEADRIGALLNRANQDKQGFDLDSLEDDEMADDHLKGEDQ